ncbi:uncharacterized protein LOC126842322 [Adelges cooleyi]|uniref:uncharacterized protein LOC126842322 n=1 Tax=Adelges cooleyi TaxID=133065 RepID=UPI00218051A3|nr:uncharacterized protein LOC126842322 [Adelges cooleyi]
MGRAQHELTSLRVLYNKVSTSRNFADVDLPRYETYRRTISRFRKDGQPENPRTMEEFSEQLKGPFQDRTLIMGEISYVGTIRGNEDEGITIIFMTPETKRLLRKAKDFYVDGTFDAAPSFHHQCQQLLVIMAKSFGYGFPIIFALMSRKTQSAYERLIQFVVGVESNWSPNTVMSDFETAIYNSFENHFPNCQHSGCFFHLGQAVWKRVQSVGK